MKRYIAIAIGIAFFSFVGPAGADSLVGVTVYKGLDGTLSDRSQRDATALARAAARKGGVLLWVGFYMPFVGNPALRTPEIADNERIVKQQLIERVVWPLVARGEAEVVPHILDTGAPGCQVRVTSPEVFSILLESRDVKSIDYVDSRNREKR